MHFGYVLLLTCKNSELNKWLILQRQNRTAYFSGNNWSNLKIRIGVVEN